MTIKKLSLSAVAAAMVATSAIAGAINTGSITTIASELLENEAVDINVSNAIQYTCTMSNTEVKSAAEAGIELSLPGISSASSLANLRVIRTDTNATVAEYASKVGSTLIFEAATGTSVVEDGSYKVVSFDSNSTINSARGDLILTLAKGSDSVTAIMKTTSNDGVSILDTASGPIAQTEPQFALSVDTALDSQIDAASGFLNFTSSGTTDNFAFKFVNKGTTLDIPATLTGLSLALISDQNLSEYVVTGSSPALGTAVTGSTIGQGISVAKTADNDHNITYASSDSNNTEAIFTSTLTTTAVGEMAVTNFTATGGVTFNGSTSSYSKQLLTDADAGKWTIYGYTAQIPNVAGLSTHDTVMKFTNRSSLDTNIYFTLIDPDGTVATLNSVDNPELASLPADTTGTYVASTLLSLVDDAAFNKAGSISVEVAIPTTPTSVYGMASFKNNALGQFKDLPVYNSGNSY